MPEIIVHLVAGRPDEQKKALMTGITEAVTKHLEVNAESVTISVVETPPALKMKGGRLFSER